MCGLAGIIDFSKNEIVEEKYFNNFLSTLNHRGPDNKSTVNIQLGYLGHTRLSIFDLSKEANQPMFSKIINI